MGSVIAAVWVLAIGSAFAAPKDPNQVFLSEISPFLKKHCLECHGADAQEGDIAFHQFKDAASVAADIKTWQRAVEMLRSGAMPPEDSPQPVEAERRRIANWIEKTIYNFDCEDGVDPGRVTIRRLNRAEYNNTVRDLLGITFRPADDFPADDVGSGFDNIGDVLTLPPLLMEKYLAAAERIAEDVIVTDSASFVKSQYRDRSNLRGAGTARYDFDRRRWTIYAAGSVHADFEFPRDGLYKITTLARAQLAGGELPKMEVRVGDQRVQVFEVGATATGDKFIATCQVAQGAKDVSAHFLNDFEDPSSADRERRDRNLIVVAIEVDGPLDVRLEDYPPAHRQLIRVLPIGQSVRAAASANLQPLLNRAFRRPATADEVSQLATVVESAVQQGDSFEQGMQVALTAVLVSPHFLFRAEGLPRTQPLPRGEGRREGPQVADLSDHELASRLSYFLWSSMPDEPLFSLADKGQLRDQATLETQIRRMLTDPKIEALVQNFVAQWLNLRLLDGVAPDPKVFPNFDTELKDAMRRETELFAAAVIREDRSLLEFVSGRFTFVNEKLAQHYGLAGIRGDEFRRIDFDLLPRGEGGPPTGGPGAGLPRFGVLTQASILTLTSNPGRTSPVKRGKWILENILGSPPPDPPADVPDFETVQKAKPNATLRQQLEIHRESPVCASCHKTMDALGFGLENFNALGQWRELDGKHKVDSSGELPGGAKFNGPSGLARVLNKRRGEIVKCLAEKMLTFALGRELRVQDRCAVDKIVDEVEAKDYRFSGLATAIANSDPFRKRRVEGLEP